MVKSNSKNPTKGRFIIIAPKHSLKPLSKQITSVFKLRGIIREVLSSFFSFWVILNKQSIIDTIKNLNGRNKASSITGCVF